MGKYFGTDGFRGEANETLTVWHAFQIGRYLGWYFGRDHRAKAVIGKDTRRSGAMLESALSAGLTASGADAYLLHVTTTPSVSWVTRTEGFDCGIMISASHNPYYDNGIKLIDAQGNKIAQEVEAQIEAYIDGEIQELPTAYREDIGIVIDYSEGRSRYTNYLKDLALQGASLAGQAIGKEAVVSRSGLAAGAGALQNAAESRPAVEAGGLPGAVESDETAGPSGRDVSGLPAGWDQPFSGFRIALDCANGSASAIAPKVFEALGAQTFVIHAEPDGLNINKNCGSTHMEALQHFVIEKGLDAGFAYDGDADRCLAVDENGNVVDGDAILYICGCYLKERGRLPGDTVVATVMSNIGLHKALSAAGISCAATAVGDRYVNEKMRECGYFLGGEQSGHIIFSEFARTGDGILTSLMLMEVMLAKKQSLKELAAGLTVFPQLLVNVRVADKQAAKQDPDVLAAVETCSRELAGNGRMLVRESGTEALIRVMAEAPTDALCKKYVDTVVEILHAKGYAVE